MSNPIKLGQLIDYLNECGLNATLFGDSEVVVNQINSLQNAQTGQITFLSDKKYLPLLETTQASAVLLKLQQVEDSPVNSIAVENPYAAYAYVAQKIYAKPFESFVHPSAVIDPTAKISTTVQIAANVVIGAHVELGDFCIIGAGCVIEDNVKIADNTKLAPNVTIMQSCQIGRHCRLESGAVIGGDGFGWANHQGKWVKIPQIGRVVIGDNVSVGNNTAIDRGAIEDTIIGDNCIIDNLVHIAHNVEIGAGSAIAGQVGFAGSAKVGKNCTFAGQAGMVGHIEITDGVTIMGRSVATHPIHHPGVYAGFPAVPIAEWQKNAIYAKNLAKLAEKIKKLNQRMDQLATSST